MSRDAQRAHKLGYRVGETRSPATGGKASPALVRCAACRHSASLTPGSFQDVPAIPRNIGNDWNGSSPVIH